MRKQFEVTLSALLLMLASSLANTASAGEKTHPIHVRNKTGGRVDFEIKDDSKMLVQSYLPINEACAIYPTDTTQNQWQVRSRKEKGEWSTFKTMQEKDGWLELR